MKASKLSGIPYVQLQCYLNCLSLLYFFGGLLNRICCDHLVFVEIDSSITKASISHVDKGIDAALRSCKQSDVSIKSTSMKIGTDRIERQSPAPQGAVDGIRSCFVSCNANSAIYSLVNYGLFD